MMKIAHLILAHKNPQQLERLIYALDHPQFDFYIHIDKKADISKFSYLLKKENIYFIKKRVDILWASYGTIQATLNGFEEIALPKYKYINVISGQDFPIKSADYIYNYIIKRVGTEFITCESINDEWKEAAHRVTEYHFINWNIPGKFRLSKILTFLLPRRKFPLDYEIVGRANWFTITENAAQYILEFVTKNPKVVRYFKYCWGADEFIFSTILYNSEYKKSIQDNLVYVDWSVNTAGHPKILNKDDLNKLVSSDKLFARKIDAEQDNTIINLLEAHINKIN